MRTISEKILKYQSVERELSDLRDGPDCTDAAEDDYLDLLDDLWQIMTVEERKTLDRTRSVTVGG